MTIDFSPEELEALRLYESATREEQAKMMRTRSFSRITAKHREMIAQVPGLREVAAELLVGRMQSEDQDTIAAMQFVIYGLSRILERPEVQQSAVVTKIMQAVHDSVRDLTIFDTNEEAILDAFAAPALSARNARSAKKFRKTDDDLNGALDLYKRWESEPDLYKTKTAFARDCVKKEYCHDPGTPERWLAHWAKDLADDHPLRKKLGVLKKR
jgi:hypothetical protein